jgi:hypothetical protein
MSVEMWAGVIYGSGATVMLWAVLKVIIEAWRRRMCRDGQQNILADLQRREQRQGFHV